MAALAVLRRWAGLPVAPTLAGGAVVLAHPGYTRAAWEATVLCSCALHNADRATHAVRGGNRSTCFEISPIFSPFMCVRVYVCL